MKENDSMQSKEDLKTTVYNAMISEAQGFYRLVITISSSFLGGSLLFYDKIASPQIQINTALATQLSLCFLALGWLGLIAAILSIFFVRKINLEEGEIGLKVLNEKANQEEITKFSNFSDRKKKLMNWTAISLTLGLFFLVVFGAINIFCKYF